MPDSAKKRRRLWAAGFLTVSSALAFLLLEFLVRVFLPHYHPARQIMFRQLEDGTPTGLPGQTVRQRTPKGDYDLPVTFNRHGFRDDEDLAESGPEDWFVLGDSFSMGWGLPKEERYSDLLAAELDARVFNIAIPTDFAGYRLLRGHAERNGARIGRLVVGVCMENDLRDYRASPEPPPDARRPGRGARLRAWCKTHSAVYLALSYELQKSAGIRALLEKLGLARGVDHPELMPRNRLSDKALESSAEELAGAFEGADEVVVLLIPARALWAEGSAEEEQRVHTKFKELLAAMPVTIVDMKPILEEAGDPMSFYFKTDSHWNAAGHRQAADALTRAIREARRPGRIPPPSGG